MGETPTRWQDRHPSPRLIVLALEDLAPGSILAQELASKTPHHIICVHDVSQVLTLVKTVIPDLFVLDLVLPYQEGFHCYGLLSASAPLKEVPTLFISTQVPPQRAEPRNKPLVSFLQRPFTVEALLRAIEAVVSL